jgi:hypothetical protein
VKITTIHGTKQKTDIFKNPRRDKIKGKKEIK